MQSSPHPDTRGILIAERDQHVRKLQQHFLEEAGFTVEFADDGESALERARLHQPSLVVTEILLPKLDGLALCRHLRDDPRTRDVPVLVFSILAAEDVVRLGVARAHAVGRSGDDPGVDAAVRDHFVGHCSS